MNDRNYVEEVMSDDECKYTLTATIPKGYQIYWYIPTDKGIEVKRATVHAQVTWGYYPLEPYGSTNWHTIAFSEEIWDDSNGGGGSSSGGGGGGGEGGGGGAVIAPPAPKKNEKIVQIIKTIYDNKNIRDKEDLTSMTMTQFQISKTNWMNMHIKMRK